MPNILKIIGIWVVFVGFVYFVLELPLYFIITVIISAGIVFFLTKTKTYIAFVISTLVVGINFALLIFAVIPTYWHSVNLQEYYENQDNYLEVNIQDDTETLERNNAQVVIQTAWQWGYQEYERYNLYEDDILNKQIKINEWERITFQSNTNTIDTHLILNLRDGSVIRLLPQTAIETNKIIPDKDDLLDSETDINLLDWEIWFSTARTILDEDWFNFNTNNWRIVIRGTSWYISQQNEETLTYSHNSVIEVINQEWAEKFIEESKAALMTEEEIEEIDLGEFIQEVGQDLYQDIQRYFEYDQEKIEQYKQDIRNYIKETFSREFEDSERLSYFGEIKMRILSYFSEEKEQQLQNYREYAALVEWERISYYEDFQESIVVPVNQRIEELKTSYLEEKALEDSDAAVAYFIDRYNEFEEEIDLEEFKEYFQENIEIDRIREEIETIF